LASLPATEHVAMSLQYLDLGKARFVSSKADVLAEITASAGLFCQDEKHLDVRPNESWGRLTVHEDVWINKSHDFHLSCVLSSDHDSTGSPRIEEKYLEDIENKLEAAQVRVPAWK
jgi:hypothetical protein